MRFAVDAHAIGRHLTGNEVYIRSLLGGFAEVDRRSEFIAYVSELGAERFNAEPPPIAPLVLPCADATATRPSSINRRWLNPS